MDFNPHPQSASSQQNAARKLRNFPIKQIVISIRILAAERRQKAALIEQIMRPCPSSRTIRRLLTPGIARGIRLAASEFRGTAENATLMRKN
jgi:hypothetical protein